MAVGVLLIAGGGWYLVTTMLAPVAPPMPVDAPPTVTPPTGPMPPETAEPVSVPIDEPLATFVGNAVIAAAKARLVKNNRISLADFELNRMSKEADMARDAIEKDEEDIAILRSAAGASASILATAVTNDPARFRHLLGEMANTEFGQNIVAQQLLRSLDSIAAGVPSGSIPEMEQMMEGWDNAISPSR